MNRPNWYSDERPSGRFQIPPVNLWSGTQQLLVLLVVVYLLQLTLAQFAVPFSDYLALSANKLANPLQWYRFGSYALAHDPRDLWHLFFNGLMIWFFGNPVESELGSKRSYFTFCACAAVFSGLTWLVVEMVRTSDPGSVIGASGIVFALIVAFATYDPQRTVLLIIFPMRAWVMASICMLFALFLSLARGDSGVAHVAHLGGGVFGYLAVRYRSRFDDLLDDLERKRVMAARRHDVETRREVDRILDKINQSGINSLTKAERRFLESASRELQKKR